MADTDVSSIISSQQGYVGSWVTQADAFIAQVAALSDTAITVDVPDDLEFEVVHTTDALIATLLGQKPARPALTVPDIGSPPTAPDIEVPDAQEVQIPTFVGSAPSLDIPPTPSLDFGSAPAAPSVDDPVLPDAPTLDFPTAPTFSAIALPVAPSIQLPVFTASSPLDDLVAPTSVFAFAEEQYQSALLDSAKAKLLDNIQNGGYGIEPDDEQALFERARARIAETTSATVDQILSGYASRGFPLEPGEARVAIGKAHQDALNQAADANRTIVLERSRLYVENRQFTLREARELETVTMQYHTAFMERTLNAAKATLDAAVAIFNSQIARYNARVAAYQAEAVVFESRIRAASTQVDIYRTEVEAAGLQQEQQRNAVELYRAQLSGVQSLVEIYRARMEAANVQASIERVRIDAFRGLVDSYSATVQANVARFQAYESVVRAQVARVDGFRGEVEAFRASAEAARAQAETSTANAQLKVERARAQISAYQGEVAAFQANADAQIRVAGSAAEIYRADAAVYQAVASAIAEGARVQVEEGANNIRWNTEVQKAKTSIAIAQIDKVKASAQLRAQTAEFGATFYQSVVAATLGSINTLATLVENV